MRVCKAFVEEGYFLFCPNCGCTMIIDDIESNCPDCGYDEGLLFENNEEGYRKCGVDKVNDVDDFMVVRQ